MNSILIKNADIVTLGEVNRILKNHHILIENNFICSIVSATSNKKLNANKIIDGTGKLVMPGFINTHMHFYSAFARGLYKANSSKNFHEVLKNLWWKLDKKLLLEDHYLSAQVSIIDAIKFGTTTIIDHHASPNSIKGSLNEIKKSCLDSGIRASLCYEVSSRDGEAKAREGIEENVNFIESLDDNSDLIRGLMGMHASFTLNDETLKQASIEAQKLKVGCHIHCAEALCDQEETKIATGKRVVERLYENGVLGPKTICAHGVHLNEEEIDLLAQTETIVVHNPQSNMNNAVGVAPIKKMMDKEILVGLGTDSMTTNMLEELRMGVWLQRLSNLDPMAGFIECSNSLIRNNAKIAGRYWKGIGEIRPGNKADIIIMNYNSPTPLDDSSFLGHLVFGLINAKVETTIVNGKILMIDGKLRNIDEFEIYRRAKEVSKKLWERF